MTFASVSRRVVVFVAISAAPGLGCGAGARGTPERTTLRAPEAPRTDAAHVPPLGRNDDRSAALTCGPPREPVLGDEIGDARAIVSGQFNAAHLGTEGYCDVVRRVTHDAVSAERLVRALEWLVADADDRTLSSIYPETLLELVASAAPPRLASARACLTRRYEQALVAHDLRGPGRDDAEALEIRSMRSRLVEHRDRLRAANTTSPAVTDCARH